MPIRIVLPLLAVSALTLSSCAYVIDDQIQSLTVETPGAEDALCNVYVDKLRYKFRPPQTMTISKSKNDLIVDCFAPGNRHQKAVVKAQIEKSTGWNVFNGVIPGATWDYASQAMFKYPAVIQVDFTNAPIMPEKMPDQNNPDIRQPEEYKLEEYRASQPKLNSDSAGGLSSGPFKRREGPAAATQSTYTDQLSEPARGPVSDKGNLKPLIPAGPSAPSQAAPVPLYPGQ